MKLGPGWLAIVACATVAQARPVLVVIAPDPAVRRDAGGLGAALARGASIAEEDVLSVPSAEALARFGYTDRQPALGPEDTLYLLLAGRTVRDGQHPALKTDDEAVPLAPLLALLASSRAGRVIVLAVLSPLAGPTVRLAELWPASDTPTALLRVDAEGPRWLVDGLDALFADRDDDGRVTVAELQRHVVETLGEEAVEMVARPAEAAGLTVAGEASADTLAPLLLVTDPRLRDDGPVLVERAGPLRVRGIVADDRRVVQVTVNGLPALLIPARDPALEDLGYPRRTFLFEAVVPVAEIGFTEVLAEARDSARNVSREVFTVLCGGPAATVPEPLEITAGGTSSLDEVVFEWGVTEDWRYGFRVRATATVHELKGRRCRLVVRFRRRGGGWLQDRNGAWRDAEGRVAGVVEFTPQYDHARISDVVLFLPQRELHLTPGQRHRLEIVPELVVAGTPTDRHLADGPVVPFDLTEPPQAATVLAFSARHNARQGEVRGVQFTSHFEVDGLKGRPVQVAVYLQYADGRPLPDANGQYRAADGSVAVFADVSPPYDRSTWREFKLFLPYDELHLTEPGEHRLRARAVLWDKTGRRPLDASAWIYLVVSRR